MIRRAAIAVAAIVATTAHGAPGAAQASREAPAEVRCPSVLGIGVETQVPFCDIVVATEARLGVRVVLPRRRGDAILSFDLHNRHTYSPQEEARGSGYVRYLASIAVATLDGEVLAEGVVLSEYRSAADLVDRISGGAGPSGLKAIAPTGTERVQVRVPGGVETVVIVGRGVEVVRPDRQETLADPGRPIAVLSRATVQYQPRS